MNGSMKTDESALNRVELQRLIEQLRSEIAEVAMYTLFEYNDEFTRDMFKNMVEPYLRFIQATGNIDRFLVVCDEINNTPEVIDSNQFVGDIYIQPSLSVASVVGIIKLNFVAMRTGVTFEEIKEL
jgi:hypothetical protein